MPPIRRKSKQSKKIVRFQKKTAPRSYSKAMYKSNKSTLFRISTFIPKQSFLRLRYNQTYYLDGTIGSEYYQIAIEMNNPNASLIQFRGTAPTHCHTNNTNNFSSEMAPLFQQYDHGIVVNSHCKTSIRPASGNYDTALHPQTAYSSTHGNYTQWTQPQKHAELITWSGNVDSLMGIGNPPDIHTLRDDTPGVQQKRLTCYPNSRAGVMFSNTYNPQRAFGIKDIGDNSARIGFSLGTEVNEKSYTQVGVQPLFTQTDCASITQTKLPRVILTVQLDYVIKFTERKSVNNISRPYGPENKDEL